MSKNPPKVAKEEIVEVVKKKRGDGYKYSPMIGDNAYSFGTDDDKAAYVAKTLSEALEYWEVPKVKSTEEAIERTKEYFHRCSDRGIKPTVEEYALCLGITRQTLWEWETGKYSAPLDPYVIKRAKDMIALFDAKAIIDGKMNPVTYIFRAKNYYGMKDQQDVVVTPNQLEARPRETLIAEAEMLPDD